MELVTFRNSLLLPGHFQVEFTCEVYFWTWIERNLTAYNYINASQLLQDSEVGNEFVTRMWISFTEMCGFLSDMTAMANIYSTENFNFTTLSSVSVFLRNALFKNTFCIFCLVPLMIIIWEGNDLLLNANSLLATIIDRGFNGCFIFFHFLLWTLM